MSVDKSSPILKRNQLEREIYESDATRTQKANMQHSLSKLWLFASEVIDQQAARADRAEAEAIEWKARCIHALGERDFAQEPDAAGRTE